MSWPKRNPLPPDSLAADGIQGAEAKTLGQCEREHSAGHTAARMLVLSAIDTAREHLGCYALANDDPEPGMVDAADLLDAAARCLASAEVSARIARTREGEA